MNTLGLFTATVFYSIYVSCLNGWLAAKLWLWFVAETFGVAAINIPQALGLGLIYQLYSLRVKKYKEEENYGERLAYAALYITSNAAMIFTMALIVKLFL
jgi:hypothetical protein